MDEAVVQDLASFSLAQASLSILAAQKLGLLTRKAQQESDKPPPLKEWLAGEVGCLATRLLQEGLLRRRRRSGL